MRVIVLDGSAWRDVLDFYRALRGALGAPEAHGWNLNAFIDSMVWSDDINAVRPPYVVEVCGLEAAPAEVRAEVVLLRDWLVKHRREQVVQTGVDVEVSIELEADAG
jgi:RNAse (barnase) inhibitor barstar